MRCIGTDLFFIKKSPFHVIRSGIGDGEYTRVQGLPIAFVQFIELLVTSHRRSIVVSSDSCIGIL